MRPAGLIPSLICAVCAGRLTNDVEKTLELLGDKGTDADCVAIGLARVLVGFDVLRKCAIVLTARARL